MRETLTRTLSGVAYILILALAIFYSRESFLVLFAVFTIMCVSEFCNLVRLNKTGPVLIAIVFYTLFAIFEPSATTGILLLIATIFVSIKASLFLFKPFAPLYKTDKYLYLIGYIVLPLTLVTKIPMQDQYNPKVIFSICILVWVSDTFAYIVGKSFGKTPLFKAISPKKTIEGFAGGFVFALVAGFILAKYYLDQPVLVWIPVAAIVVVFGTLGDLIESKFKRLAEVKDSGRIMPGHGGILDRLDSVIFAAPFVLLFFQILGYVS